jgi:hypothetical protein
MRHIAAELQEAGSSDAQAEAQALLQGELESAEMKTTAGRKSAEASRRLAEAKADLARKRGLEEINARETVLSAELLADYKAAAVFE